MKGRKTNTANQERDEQVAIDWSDDMCRWVVDKAFAEDLHVTQAIYGTLTTAVVLARAVGMQDSEIVTHFRRMIEDRFPEELGQFTDQSLH